MLNFQNTVNIFRLYSSMIIKEKSNWTKFHQTSLRKKNYPRYPNEIILKIIFGNYSNKRIILTKKSKILDVGCGFGNNLLPFLDKNFRTYGVEIDKKICEIAKKILKKRYPKKRINIDVGHNRFLPYRDNTFDLLITNTLHYEENQKNVDSALKEYSRVIKRNKFFLVITTGDKHDFFKKTKKIGKNIYIIKNKKDKIRNGKKFFFFKNQKFLKKNLKKYFKHIDIGRVTEIINNKCFDVYLGLCMKK